MEIKEQLIKTLQDIFGSAMKNTIDEYGEITSVIPETTNGVWGKTIIIAKEIDNNKYEQKEKELTTIKVDLLFSKKALNSCKANSSALLNLIYSVAQRANGEAIIKKNILLLDQIKIDLGINVPNEVLYRVLLNIRNETDKIQEYIEFYKLCDWQWLPNLNKEEGILFDEGDFYRASFVLYGNYMFDDKLKDEIKKRLKV